MSDPNLPMPMDRPNTLITLRQCWQLGTDCMFVSEVLQRADLSRICPGRPGRLSGLSDFHSKSVLYGVFVRARRVIHSQKRRFPARAVLFSSREDNDSTVGGVEISDCDENNPHNPNNQVRPPPADRYPFLFSILYSLIMRRVVWRVV